LRDREARLTHMALHDQETGLPNRLSLERQAASHPGRLCRHLFGVDRFEIVRNAIGYDSMAQLLAQLGARLSALTDGSPSPASAPAPWAWSFHAENDAEALAIAEGLCRLGPGPLKLNGAPVDVSVSAGLARSGKSLSSVDSTVDRAAIALDQARGARRRCGLFDASAYGDPGGNLSLISELMSAVDNGDVWLAYQPKYDLRAEVINGCEALMRWPTRAAASSRPTSSSAWPRRPATSAPDRMGHPSGHRRPATMAEAGHP
jgi:predicted signal transduction protein with EAL and GGDEF domain